MSDDIYVTPPDGVPRMDDAPPMDYGDGEPLPRHTWQRVDLTDVLAGRYTPPMPTVGGRSDGHGMYYPGRLHTAASESEGGKTWLGLHGVRHELDKGNGSVYLDFEDNEGGIVGRLLALGASRDSIRDRFAYVRPDESIAALGNRGDLLSILNDLRPTLVVLDGVTEAMTMHGLELKDNTDVATFGALLPRWIADQGPAVTALDHVVKAADSRGRYAIGAVHKLNGLNGCAYTLENRTSFRIGSTGRSGIFVSKDRPGQVRRWALKSAGNRDWFGDLVINSHNEEFVEVEVEPPSATAADFRPTIYMTRISEAMTKNVDLMTQNAIELATKGKGTEIRAALKCLVMDGYVSVKSPHKLLKPYPDGDPS